MTLDVIIAYVRTLDVFQGLMCVNAMHGYTVWHKSLVG